MATELKRMQSMRGTSADFAANDIVLLDGELAIEFLPSGDAAGKVGDGVQTFSQLPYSFGIDDFVPLTGTTATEPVTGPIEFESALNGLNWQVGILDGITNSMSISAEANAQADSLYITFGAVTFEFNGTTQELTLPDIDYSAASGLAVVTKQYVDDLIAALDARVTALENP